MARFQVVLAGLMAGAATGLVMSAGLLVLGMVESLVRTHDSGLSMGDVGTFVLILVLVGASGMAVGVLMAVLPVLVLALTWDRLPRAWGAERSIAFVVPGVGVIVAVEMMIVLVGLFEIDSVRVVLGWSLTTAVVAVVTGTIALVAAWRAARGTSARITRY